MKNLFILLFAAFSITLSAQDTNPKVAEMVDQEIKMIQKDLASNEEVQTLSGEQTAQLKKLLYSKAQRINVIRDSKEDKLSKSKSLNKISKEFEPAILAVLNNSQKEAFKSSPRNKKRYVKK